MFGLTIGLYKGKTIERFFESGKRYLIKIMRRPGYYVIREVWSGQEFIYMDCGKILDNWEIDRKIL